MFYLLVALLIIFINNFIWYKIINKNINFKRLLSIFT
jgi:hypothetical protein